MELLKSAEQISGIFSVAGCEEKMREYIIGRLQGSGVTCETDNAQNLICRKGNAERAVLIVCGMDFDGIIATSCEENSIIHVSPLGSPDLFSASYAKVEFESGVTGFLIPPKGLTGDTKLVEMSVDAGGKTVAQGERARLESRGVAKLSEKLYAGLSLAKSMCLAIMLELLCSDLSPSCGICCAFTSQSSLAGGRGESIASKNAGAKRAVYLSVCREDSIIKCENGAVIGAMDKNFSASQSFTELMARLCKANDIPHSMRVNNETLSAAAFVQSAGAGCETGELLLASRHEGTFAETISIDDAKAVSDLLFAVLRES